ncbi:MAG: cytochrome b5-like heme/steroid binding domain-containing protein [Myxococcales bacterium]
MLEGGCEPWIFVVGLIVGFRRFIAGFFGRNQRRMPTVVEAEVRDYTLHELSEFDGSDPGKPLLIAIRGHVYDVTRGRDFYGPGGPYEMFAGKDCTRALAKVSFDPPDFTGDVEGLDREELAKLEEWIELFEGKYRRVGTLIGSSEDCAPH